MHRSVAVRLCFCLLVLVTLIHGSPVANSGSGSGSGNGPLGTSPGGPAGPVPVGSGGSGGGNSTTSQPAQPPGSFKIVSRAVNTALAVLSTVLMTVTYAVLIGPGTRLSTTSKVPLGAVRENIGNLLSRAWPDVSTTAETERDQARECEGEDAIRLFYVGKFDGDGDGETRKARGVEECAALPKSRIPTPSMWLTSGSSLTKNMVQVAIWEWVCVWMVLGMMVATLTFNGFFSNHTTPDAYPRLVVAMIYVSAFCVHAWYVWKTVSSFFTLFAAGGSWSLLNKASFASVDRGQLEAGVKGGSRPLFRKIGKPSSSPTFPPYENCQLKGVEDLTSADSAKGPSASADEDEGAVNTVDVWQRAEIQSTVQAGVVALERVITNVVTIVGITITTGFASWTSISDTGDSTTQLGSLALLASLTIGTGAMFSSAIELSVMATSFRNVLFYKEIMINRQATAYVQKRAKKKNIVGFTHETVKMKRVGLKELAGFAKPWALMVFGPGYALLPSEEDHFRQSAGAQFEFCAGVRDKKVLLTTEATSEHQTNSDGGSVDAINVCYLADEERRARSPSSVSSESKQPQVSTKLV